jgi:hypothetical protein
MTEIVSAAVVLLAPALLLLVWLALMATIVGALGASSDGELDELRLLRPHHRPS